MIKTIVKLIEPKTLIASLVPVTYASAFSLWYTHSLHLQDVLLVLMIVMLMQSSANMINDLFDYSSGADTSDRGDEKAHRVSLWVDDVLNRDDKCFDFCLVYNRTKADFQYTFWRINFWTDYGARYYRNHYLSSYRLYFSNFVPCFITSMYFYIVGALNK